MTSPVYLHSLASQSRFVHAVSLCLRPVRAVHGLIVAALETLTGKLIALKLTCRVFSTDLSILQAKWSE